jgi:two-component system response regulator NreC
MVEEMINSIRTLIVDDHLILREGLVSLLESQPDFLVVGEAGSVEEAISVARESQPDLVLMDFGLPDGSGLDATQAILANKPDTKIVFLTVHEEDDKLFGAIRYGAKGYLLKNIPAAKMLTALRGLMKGEAPLSRKMTGRILNEFKRGDRSYQEIHDTFKQLTQREIEVLKEMVKGATNPEIAEHLVISVNTVKNHVSNILKKLEVKNRREAANLAKSHGIGKT